MYVLFSIFPTAFHLHISNVISCHLPLQTFSSNAVFLRKLGSCLLLATNHGGSPTLARALIFPHSAKCREISMVKRDSFLQPCCFSQEQREEELKSISFLTCQKTFKVLMGLGLGYLKDRLCHYGPVQTLRLPGETL